MSRKSSSSDIEAPKDADEQTIREQPHGFKERISHFTWSNFACTMSTGAIAVVLANQPFKFRGLDVIAKIFFIFDIVLFLLFCSMMTARFIWFPWKLTKSLHFPTEALLFPSAFVSAALILNLTCVYGIPACGPWLVTTMKVFFWIYSALALMVAIFQYLTLFVAEKMPVSSAMPAWVFPVYPFLVIGPLAGVLLPHLADNDSLPIFVGGVLFQGLGWTVAMFMYSIYVVRLMSNELPAPPTRPGMFISVGPAGYTAAALVALGNRAPSVVPADFLSLGDFNVGATIKVLGVMSALFIWLVAFWFFALSLIAVLEGVKDMSFTLNWWAFVFPNAGLTLATIQLGNVLDCTGIKAVTSAMSIILVIAWFFVAASHISALYQRKIMWESRDEDAGMVPNDAKKD